MDILCAGLSHRTAPVEIREKFAIGIRELPRITEAILKLPGVHGVVVLSTCNRVEFYLSADNAKAAFDALDTTLHNRFKTRAPFYQLPPREAISHLFSVACGLDSMVPGETEIFGQIKKAYQAAIELNAADPALHQLFQKTFHVAKHIRTETHITRGPTSIASVAVTLAENTFGRLDGRGVMILGAGETSQRTARGMVSRGAKTVLVSNRTFARASRLADEIGGTAIRFEEWETAFETIDILICSTSAPRVILTKQKLSNHLSHRAERPLFVIDLAVPRDADPAIREIPNVILHDIDSLDELAKKSVEIRRSEIIRCQSLISQHITEFLSIPNPQPQTAQ